MGVIEVNQDIFPYPDGGSATPGDPGVAYPCRVVAESNITLENLQTIDGISLAEGEYVLVAGQTDATENGPYAVVDGGAWTRLTNAEEGDDISQTVYTISEGTLHAGQIYICTNAVGSGVVGTDNITFTMTTSSLIEVKGTIDATLAANLPASPEDGDMYRVGVAGSFEDDASISPAGAYFNVGDCLFWFATGSVWQKWESDDHLVPNSLTGSELSMAQFTSVEAGISNNSFFVAEIAGNTYICYKSPAGVVKGVGIADPVP